MAEGTEGLQTNESGSRATPVEEAGAWEGELNFFYQPRLVRFYFVSFFSFIR